MKTIKITRLSGTNFQGYGEIELTPRGRNIVISGENGSGKTTHFNLYTWLICGKMSDGKTAEVANYNDAQIVIGEVEFDNGMTFRRESNGKYFVNGVPTTQSDYFKQVDAMMNGGANVLAMPFNFCRLHWKDRRDILIRIAGKISAADIIANAPEIAEIADLLKRNSADEIKKRAADKRKRLKADADKIPAQIAAFKAQFDEIIPKFTVSDLQNLRDEIAELQEKTDASVGKCAKFEIAIDEIQAGITKANNQIRINETKRKMLEAQCADFDEAAITQICPICGGKINSSTNKKLCQESVTLAKDIFALNEKNAVLQRSIDAAKSKLEELYSESASALSEQKRLRDRYAKLTIKSMEVTSDLEKCKFKETLIEKVEAFEKRHVEISAQIAACDRQIYLAEMYTRTQAKLLTSAINGKFQFVRFKLFEEYKSQEGLRECCEPLMAGVPYESLSNGEKFKAATDIMRTLQKHYQVQAPIWIDDAEGYTSNSLIKIGGQQTLTLRVKDARLEISYGD